MEFLHHLLMLAVEALVLVIELIGVTIIAIGIGRALWLIAAGLIRQDPVSYVRTRLSLSKFLALALEFQLAADILETALSPTWEHIGKLAAIAVIRTALNYFLQKEMKEEAAELEAEREKRAVSGKPQAR
jgi:uncharacterized membrane protein